jgi:hypothetical protein
MTDLNGQVRRAVSLPKLTQIKLGDDVFPGRRNNFDRCRPRWKVFRSVFRTNNGSCQSRIQRLVQQVDWRCVCFSWLDEGRRSVRTVGLGGGGKTEIKMPARLLNCQVMPLLLACVICGVCSLGISASLVITRRILSAVPRVLCCDSFTNP